METYRELEDIIADFNLQREAFRAVINKGDVNKHSLLEFQGRFIDLKSELRYWKKYLTREWTRRDDKAATAIKFRIAMEVTRGDFKDDGATEPLAKCSITSAEKYASGSLMYKKFVDQRAHYKESLTNVTDLREDMNSYINEIKDRLK